MGWTLLFVFSFSLVVFVCVMIGMAIGYVVSGRRLEGSCGGIANRAGDGGIAKCSLCEHSSSKCDLLASQMKTVPPNESDAS